MTKVWSKMAKDSDNSIKPHKKFPLLFFIEFTIIFVGIALAIAAILIGGEDSASFGGVIFIWFFPIVFGAGTDVFWILPCVLILAVIGLIILLVWVKGRSRTKP